MTTGVYPGSYDPVTNGHIDIIRRGAALCDTLYVVALNNRDKKSLFTRDERMGMLKMATAEFKNVRVDVYEGLLADYCQHVGASFILRGLRNGGDYEAECVNANINRLLCGVETLFLPASPGVAFVSSSVLKDIALYGGDITSLTCPLVADEIKRILRDKNHLDVGRAIE